NLGGSITLLQGTGFDPQELWSTVAARKVAALVIVGDAFAKPMLAELDNNPDKYDLSSVVLISSSGVMWSKETKDGLLRHIPHAVMFDSFGSSEAVGLGASVSSAGQATNTASFQLGERVHVFTEEGNAVEPGSPD